MASHRSALQRAFVRRCFHVLALPVMADYTQWFAVADTDGDGKVSGAEAVQFFQRAGLPQQSLAQLWELVSESGFLERKQFDIAMQLITIAQVRRPCICNDPKALIRGRVLKTRIDPRRFGGDEGRWRRDPFPRCFLFIPYSSLLVH